MIGPYPNRYDIALAKMAVGETRTWREDVGAREESTGLNSARRRRCCRSRFKLTHEVIDIDHLRYCFQVTLTRVS